MGNTRNTGKGSSRVSGSSSAVEFLNVRLTDEDKQALGAGANNVEEILDTAFRLVDEGYKLSVSLDAKNHSYLGSITLKQGGVSKVLTGRGSTAINALASLLYRHVVLLRGDWSNYEQTDSRPGDFF